MIKPHVVVHFVLQVILVLIQKTARLVLQVLIQKKEAQAVVLAVLVPILRQMRQVGHLRIAALGALLPRQRDLKRRSTQSIGSVCRLLPVPKHDHAPPPELALHGQDRRARD